MSIDRQPCWSPDGQMIAFSSDRFAGGRQGRYSLFLYEQTGAEYAIWIRVITTISRPLFT